MRMLSTESRPRAEIHGFKVTARRSSRADPSGLASKRPKTAAAAARTPATVLGPTRPYATFTATTTGTTAATGSVVGLVARPTAARATRPRQLALVKPREM